VRLTILGSGTVDPLPQRACSGYFLETSIGHLLVDVGNGVVRRAIELERPLPAVRHLFLSHLHPDHTSDLVTLLFARKHAPPPWHEVGDLTIYGPEGTESFVQALYAAWPSIQSNEEGPQVRVMEFPVQEQVVFSQAEFSVTAVPVEHGDMNAVGYRFLDQARCFAYSGDSKLCPGVKRVAEGADLFVCECSCFPRGCEPLYCRNVHLSWEDVAEICQQSQPGQVVLTHLYEPVLNRKPNPLDCLLEALDIPVSLAEDGLTITV
jgi:ribonuclease BN (tRNA processing enzyme)